MWSTSSMDARADARRAQRRRTNGDSPRSRVAPLAAEGLPWTAAERVALQRGEDLREAEARNAVAVCGWMDGMCLRRVRVDRRHQGAIYEQVVVDVKQGGDVPPGPPPPSDKPGRSMLA